MVSDRILATSLKIGSSAPVTLDRYVALGVGATALLPLPGISVFTGSALAFLIMFPVLAPIVRQTPGLKVFAILGMLVIIGASLANFVAGGSAGTVPSWDWLARPVSLLLSVAALAWSTQHLGLRNSILIAIPAPLVFDWIARSSQGNDWKYSLSLWVTVGALVAIHKWSFAWRLPVLTVLIIVSALNGTRGIIAMLVIAATVELLARGGRTRTRKTAMAVVGSGLAAIAAFQLAIVGALGSSIQQTMLMQTEYGPLSILRAARPESGGNLSLVFQDPWRFVISDSVTAEQAAIIRNSFSQVSRDPNSLYVSQNVLHGAELHSIAADLWLHLGLFGLIAGFAAVVLFVVAAFRSVWIPSNLTFVGLFVSLRAIWDLMFSPASDLRFWPLYILLALYIIFEKGALGERSH
ncbi:putative integral membrane protein [Paenarthrobacter aurescens TC1]|uniref:Integral membrane protein n=2 Tax=Paenarthrobacter aurescens TaxID=43663 RepID=A1R9F2_PAEAT|nr:putative integral membrane protein [Paenarthrobacter aurescens TC1]